MTGAAVLDLIRDKDAASFTGSQATDGYILGSAMVLLAAVPLGLYLKILHLFLVDKLRFSTPAYSLMFHLGVADCIQLAIQVCGGFFAIFGTSLSPLVNKVTGGILNTGWFACIPLTLLLAFNRFVVFCLPKWDSRFYSKRGLRIQIAAAWAWSALSFLVYMSPFCSVIFDTYYVGWSYDRSAWSPAIVGVEIYSMLSQMLLTAVFYVLIIAKLVYLRYPKKVLSKENRREVRIFMQSILISVYTTLYLLLWHWHLKFLPHTQMAEFVVNFGWIFNASINPVLCLLINATIRHSFLKSLGIKKKVKKNTSTVTSIPKTGHGLVRITS